MFLDKPSPHSRPASIDLHSHIQIHLYCAPTGRDIPGAGEAFRRDVIAPARRTRLDDGHGEDDLLHLIVEIKGYRREDAKEKKSTMDTYWVPGVNHLGTHGRWAFAEFTELYQIEAAFKAKVESEFNKMIDGVIVEKADALN